MDPNLQFVQCPPDPQCLEEIQKHSTSARLSHNVRSTVEIVKFVRSLLQADLGISRIDGFGVQVTLRKVSQSEHECAAALELVEAALAEGVHPADIAILGPDGAKGPVCSSLLRRIPELLQALSPEGRIQSRVHGIVASLEAFRGLEARVVVLVDLHRLAHDHSGKSALYTGITRATASLNLLVSPPFNDFVKGLLDGSV